MENRNIIIILSIIVIILAIGVVFEIFALNNNNTPAVNTTSNTTPSTTNTTVEHISSDPKSSSSENSIEANRPKNDPNYKGYTPYHESEVTKDGWNPSEHETYRETMADGNVKIHYDDGYFRIVDKNGYVITYGYG